LATAKDKTVVVGFASGQREANRKLNFEVEPVLGEALQKVSQRC
jgi:hypothetical protein